MLDQRRIATEATHRVIPLANVPVDPVRRHAWLLAHDPHVQANVVVRDATPGELATYRAAALAQEQHLTAGQALQRCRAVVPVAVATACQVAPRAGFDLGAQPANCNDCPPPSFQRTSTADGSYTSTSWRTLCETVTPATAYAPNNQPVTTPTSKIVTITGYPGTNGPIPGAQTTGTLAGKTGPGTTPSPNYVPLGGWMVAPGLTYNGKPVDVYVWPDGQTSAKPGTVTMNIDANDWYDVIPESNNSFEFYGYFNGRSVTSPIITFPEILNQQVGRRGGVGPDAFSAGEKEAFACAFALTVFTFWSAAAIETGGVTLPAWIAAAGTVGGACGPYVIDVTLADD